ncbi:MAG: hypothetical protein PHG16_11790 [Lachnospiraceae bacterium]|nr:hypothetical protein [Lachnospiraceae bacterium]
MTKERIYYINAPKKRIALTGHLSLPLRIGERAWICVAGQSITTSLVKQILEVSESRIIFETCNTIYSLSYARVPARTEVMCA